VPRFLSSYWSTIAAIARLRENGLAMGAYKINTKVKGSGQECPLYTGNGKGHAHF